MAEIDRAGASFRLFDDTLNPHVISKLLGLQPSEAGSKGDVQKPPRRKSSAPIRWRTGTWILRGRLADSATLDAHLKDILVRLEPNAKAIQDLVGQGYRADFFCGCFLDNHSNEMTAIEPETLRLIAQLGVPLRLDIYSLSESTKP